MKPETIQFLFDCYLKEKQTSSNFDEVDGISWTSKVIAQGALSGEPNDIQTDRCDELLFLNPEPSSPYESHFAPLDPYEEEIARNFGRQLSNMSNEFEERTLRIFVRNSVFQFEKPCIFVSPATEKIEIPIVRLGNPSKEFTVGWKTKDKTAKAGTHYAEAEGDLLFSDGEMKKIIEIQLLNKHQDENICFTIDILDQNFIDIGEIHSFTVNIVDYESLDRSEKNVIKNIIESSKPSISHIASCLRDKITVNTFQTALMYMCSNANSVPQEFAFAFELLRIALPSARRESLMNVMCNFFRNAPELEDMQEYIEENSSDDSDDDSD